MTALRLIPDRIGRDVQRADRGVDVRIGRLTETRSRSARKCSRVRSKTRGN